MTQQVNVAIFVQQGVQLLDFAGPMEVFSDTMRNGERLFNVYAVAENMEDITTDALLKIKPAFSIKNCPQPDIIVFAGGAVDAPINNPEVIQWICQTSSHTQYVITVCTGVFLAAHAGLLNGKQATTHYASIDKLARNYPAINVVRGKRFVDNGRVITTEGISAGIDGSLYLVSKIFDQKTAEETAHYMMYNWQPQYREVILP